jgi:UDP-GlcNAc3NAcA epimerase
MKYKICTIIGARPQFIKASSLSRIFSKSTRIDDYIIHTGQHYDTSMSEIFFEQLNIPKPIYNLNIGGGSHGQNTGRMIEAIEKVLIYLQPDCVIVYGDTDSTLAASIAASKINIKIIHIESGLRSFNKQMPEEINRILTDHLSELLFVPSDISAQNLLNEGINKSKIFKVGDVMYDSALYYSDKSIKPLALKKIQDEFILTTVHRAENTNNINHIKNIIYSLNEISRDMKIVFPIHPRTKKIIDDLNLNLSSNIKIITPVGYLEMIWLIQNSNLVITDSGGLQKEAYFHKKKCITLRDQTEWEELTKTKYNILSPPCFNNIVRDYFNIKSILFSSKEEIYGNGDSAEKIYDIIIEKFA